MSTNRQSIKNIVETVMKEEGDYKEFFKKALKKAGKSIPQMSDEEKKQFFNKIDKAWKGKKEKTNESKNDSTYKFDKNGVLTHVKTMGKFKDTNKKISHGGVDYFKDDKSSGWTSKDGTKLTKKIIQNESLDESIVAKSIEIGKLIGAPGSKVESFIEDNNLDVKKVIKFAKGGIENKMYLASAVTSRSGGSAQNKMIKQLESVNEANSSKATEIAKLIGARGEAVQKFIDDNDLDIRKVIKFAKNASLMDKMDLVSAISGKKGNPTQNKMVKQFESKRNVNESSSVKRKGSTYYVDSNFVNNSKSAGNLKHMGMGDFSLDVKGGGTITFNRIGEKFPNFTGRAHRVGGDATDIKKAIGMMKGIQQESIVNEANFKKDDLVFNKKTKTVGIVRLPEKQGEIKTDADGNVNVKDLEKYNPYKNKSHQKAKAAPSTQKEVDKRGLFKPFQQESIINEEHAGYVAIYKGKRIEIDKSEANGIADAKELAIKRLKVPKSKTNQIAIKPGVTESVNEAQKINPESKKFLKGMKKIKVNGLGGYMPGVDYIYVDDNKFYFVDSEGDHMELKNNGTIKQLKKLHGKDIKSESNINESTLKVKIYKHGKGPNPNSVDKILALKDGDKVDFVEGDVWPTDFNFSDKPISKEEALSQIRDSKGRAGYTLRKIEKK